MATFKMSVEVPVKRLAKDLGLSLNTDGSLYQKTHYITQAMISPKFPGVRIFSITEFNKLPAGFLKKLENLRYLKRIDRPTGGQI